MTPSEPGEPVLETPILQVLQRTVEQIVDRLLTLISRQPALRDQPQRIYSAAVAATIGVMTLLAIFVSLLSGGNEGANFVASALAVDTETLVLDAPTSVEAGNAIPVTVSGLRPGVPLELTVEAGYGLRPLIIEPDTDTVQVNIPPIDGPASGTAVITAIQEAGPGVNSIDDTPDADQEQPVPGQLASREDDPTTDSGEPETGTGTDTDTDTQPPIPLGWEQRPRVASATVEIEPGPPIDPMDAYLGPRTVIADGAHFVMIVTVPTDRFGNPVEPGTVVDYTVTRADLEVEQADAPTEHLLSWFEVFSNTVAGRTRIGAQVEQVSGVLPSSTNSDPSSDDGPVTASERTFLEVAGIPVAHSLELLDAVPVADGQALIRARTSVLEDRFGNVLPDGTVVTLDADGVGGIRRLNSQTNGGRAEFTYEVPEQPGRVTLKATASGVSGEPLVLRFEPAVESFNAWMEPQLETVLVHVGPVRSIRDSYVPEGTVAEVTMTGSNGKEIVRRVDLTLGAGTAFFPSDVDTSTAVVRVLGEELVLTGTGRDSSLDSSAVGGER